MIQLMAEAPGDQFLALSLEPLTVPVLRANLGIVGALHQTVLARNAEAPLRAALLAAGLHQFRIHQLQNFLAGIHDHNPAQNAHLGGGQSHAVSFGQGIGHVVQQFVQPPVEFLHRTAYLMQRRVFVCQNFAQSHDITSFLLW